MMRGGGYGVYPGQRVMSRQDLTTEIKITLRHIAWSTVFGWLFVIISRALLLQLLREAVEAWALLEYPARLIYVWWFKIGIPLVPLLTLSAGFISFITQTFDVNWPPPRAAQRAADGPNAPGWLRGFFMPPDPQPDTLQVYSQRAPEPQDARDTVTMDIALKTDGKTTRHVRPTLERDEWQIVRKAIAHGDSVSVRDLIKHGLTPGPEGSARRVNSELMRFEELWKLKRNKPYPTPEYRKELLKMRF